MRLKKEILKTSNDRRGYFVEDACEVNLREKAMTLYAPNALLQFFCEWGENVEPELLDWIDTLAPDSVYFDVGASNGMFGLYAATSGLEVTAFEADALNYAILEINRFLNQASLQHSFRSFNLAISSNKHIGELGISRFGFGTHNKVLDSDTTREGNIATDIEHMQSVLSMGLDVFIKDFNYPTPDFIKVDIDGSELNFINGACETLTHVKELFIELSEEHKDYPVILHKLDALGFQESARHGVKHPNGGVYPGLFNFVFKRDNCG